jgi:hypothetical protein
MATSNEYVFVTHWRVEASIEEVSEILQDALSLPRWWPSVYLEVREVEPARVGGHGEGRVIELFTRGWLPYTLRWRFRVTETHPPHGFSLEAWGDLVGTGEWTLTQVGRQAEIVYDWRVRADKPLLRYLSFVFKPIFAANHRWAMARGEESLKRELLRRHAAQPAPTTQATNRSAPGRAG